MRTIKFSNQSHIPTDTYTASKEDGSDVNQYIMMANSSGHSFECIVPPASVDQARPTDQVARCITTHSPFFNVEQLCLQTSAL